MPNGASPLAGHSTRQRKGTLALSWGPSGGFYLHPRRVCLGRVALTYVPGVEIDDLMEDHIAVAASAQSTPLGGGV